MVTAHRIVKSRYAATAMSGEGARLAGGRWNPIGMRMVYLSSSLSLATLELLVHIDEHALILQRFSHLAVTFPEEMIEYADPSQLPEMWDSDEVVSSSQFFGAEWLRSGKCAILAVPSVVTPSELNYLANPEHPDFAKLQIGPAQPFSLDQRLGK